MTDKWHRSTIFLGVASMPCRLGLVETFETLKNGYWVYPFLRNLKENLWTKCRENCKVLSAVTFQ